MKDTLKSMLQDVINGKEEQAAVSLHEYFVEKAKQVTGLSEAAEATIVVMKVSYDYISQSDREKTGTATMFHKCASAEEAQALKEKIEAKDELIAKSPEDTITHMGQNTYNDFESCHGDAVYASSVKVVATEPTGSKVFAFSPKEFGL